LKEVVDLVIGLIEGFGESQQQRKEVR